MLGIGGVAVLVLDAGAHLDTVGVAAGLVGAASMATGTTLIQRWGRPTSALAFAGWQLAAGGVLLVPLAIVFEGIPDSLDGRNVLGYTYLAIVGGALAYALWFRGIELLGAQRATFLSLLSPVVATSSAWHSATTSASGSSSAAPSWSASVAIAQTGGRPALPASAIRSQRPDASHPSVSSTSLRRRSASWR